MPISPQDFELYSRMTGRSLPRDPAERMRIAPEVYDFTRNFGREPNVLQKAGNLLGNIGRDVVRSVQGGARLGYQELQDERNREFELEKERIKAGARESKAEDMLRNFAEKERIKKENRMEMNEQVVKGKMRIKREEQEAKMERDEKLADLKQRANENRGMRGTVVDVTPMTDRDMSDPLADPFESPSQRLDNEIVNNQTAIEVINKATEKGASLADSTTIAENLRQDQTSTPVNQDNIETVTGSGFARDYSEKKGFIPKVETDLDDHPDVEPGENDSGVPNFAPTQDAVNKMAMDKAVGMGDQFMGNYGDKSPNEAEGQVTAYKDSLLGAIRDGIPKSEQDAARQRIKEKTLRKRGEKGTTGGLFGTDIGMDDPKVQENYRQLKRNAGLLDDKVIQGLALTKAAEEYQQKRQTEGVEGALGSIDIVGAPSVNDKADDFISNYARTDFQVGGMQDRKTGLGKSVGISYTPMNGDTKVGFNIMQDPTKPTEVSTYDFQASPEAMESMETGDLRDLTFGKLFNKARKGEGGFGKQVIGGM